MWMVVTFRGVEFERKRVAAGKRVVVAESETTLIQVVIVSVNEWGWGKGRWKGRASMHAMHPDLQQELGWSPSVCLSVCLSPPLIR